MPGCCSPLQEQDTIRAAAMALFGDLVAMITGRETSDLRNQVHQSMVPLLLHLKDQCPAVTKVSAHLSQGAYSKGPSLGQAEAPATESGCPDLSGPVPSPQACTALPTLANT